MSDENKVFKEIALSLSGGGYRAAAFHLGTLRMLDKLRLLRDVKVLSTVSGGTITGVAYAKSLAEGESFEGFYRKTHAFLRDTNVITMALSTIRESTEINQNSAMPSLIRSAANVYSSPDFLGDKTFNLLLEAPNYQLKELAFNSTDFRSGNCFRFTKSESSRVRSGNNSAQIKSGINKLIRLSDIVAASSCFPSGFEPIRFPSDFVWPESIGLEKVRKQLGEKFQSDIPLMDGGVFDNQGIDSIDNIYKRENAEIGLYIISDTDQRNAELFSFPSRPKRGRIPLKWLYLLIWGLLIASVVTFITIALEAFSDYKNGALGISRGIFLYFIPFILSLGVASLIIWARYSAVKAQNSILEQTGFHVWTYLKNLSMPEVIELVDSRVRSLVAMSGSVFMKRIRELGYEKIFATPDFEKKVLPNVIYDMDNESRWGKEIIDRGLQPSTNLRMISRNAESYATNLWFLNENDLKNLIACGEATMCFKVLKYLLRYRSSEIAIAGTPEAELFSRTKDIWIELNK